MLKVLPIQSKLRQEEICGLCHVTYNPDLLAYSAEVDGELRGICQFKLTAEGGEIHDLAPVEDTRDFEAMFVLGRGTLNFIDLCGVHYARCVGTVTDEPLLRAVGFKQTESGSYEINLEGFFTDHCSHHES